MFHRRADALFTVVTRTAGAVSGGVLLVLAAVIAWHALAALGDPGLSALLGTRWQPSSGHYGVAPLVFGTLAVAALTLLIAVVGGAAAGLAVGWLLPARVATGLRLLLLIAAGIPSVVWGLWGLTTLVPLIGRWAPPGTSWLSASLVLAALLLPTVAVSVDSSLRAVPASARQAVAATGLSPWAGLAAIGLRPLRHGLVVGSTLALARALGETMVILLVAGNVAQFPRGLGDPLRTLTGAIALEMGYASGAHLAALFALGAIALAVVVAILVLAQCLGGDREVVLA